MKERMKELERICAGYDIIALYAFGSRSIEVLRALQDVSSTLKSSTSDLDIGVLTGSRLSLERKVNLTLELEEFFGVPRVDLVVLQEADAFLGANIVRGERIYIKNSYLADEYELFVLGHAGDLAALERERMAMVLREE